MLVTGPMTAKEARTYKEKKEAEVYRALRRYGRTFGGEALVAQRAIRERRAKSGLPVPEPPPRPKCGFAGEPCKEDVAPAAKYCITRMLPAQENSKSTEGQGLADILSQEGQLLFRECETEQCHAPIPPLGSVRHCWLHRPIPLHKAWKAKEEPADLASGPSLQAQGSAASDQSTIKTSPLPS